MQQPCLSCGRNTAAGTRLFSARKRGRDTQADTDGFLCYSCQPGSAASGSEQSIPLIGRYAVIDLAGGLPGG